jgi:hypothetical protein
MLEKFRKVDNPLTIIAIFAGITEVAASVALPFLHQDTQQVFVWFLILFPFALIIAFFTTLNFNTRVLYAPSDYRDDKTFLEALRLSQDTVQLSVTSPDDIAPSIQEVKRITDQQPGMSPFDGITQAELDNVNSMLEHFQRNVKNLFESNLITGYTFGVHGEGLFLLTVMFDEVHGPGVESRIIRASTLPDGRVELSIIGKGLKSSQPEQFAEILFRSFEGAILQRREHERERAAKKERPNQQVHRTP